VFSTNRPELKDSIRIGLKVDEQFDIFVESGIRNVVIVDDLTRTPAPTNWPKKAWGRVGEAGGGAGTNVQCFAKGVGGRGVVYRVDGAWIVRPNDGTSQVRVGNGNAAATEDTDKRYLDIRDTGVPNLITESSTPLTAAIEGALIATYDSLALESFFIPLGITLGDDDFVNIVNGTTNETYTVNYEWTEFLLEAR